MTLSPIIILVRPQLVENIGTTARAMLNCALADLRLVAPRDPWPSQTGEPMEPWIKERLYAAASGADAILDQAQVFPDLRSALADINHVYATTARDHDMIKQWHTPHAAVAQMRERITAGEKVGILFGPERTGLIHEDMTCANEVICVPTNPKFSSLNLAQAVLILGYEWYQAADSPAPTSTRREQNRSATKVELHHLFDRLETELDQAGFFTTPEIRPTMIRNIRNALQRAEMTEQEVRTWHGIVTALSDGPKRKKN
ncbi:MAG: RNA methyltransferase [Alphaproteobacteria bacterium]